MKFYLSEECVSRITHGSLEARLVAVRNALIAHHQGEAGPQRKILATFEDAAVVAEDTGGVFHYHLEPISNVLTVTRRDPISWAVMVPELEHAAKSVVEGKTPKSLVVADVSQAGLEDVVLECIDRVLRQSEFLKVWSENASMIEAMAWEDKSTVGQDSNLTDVIAEACRSDARFRDELAALQFWVRRLPKDLSESTKTGESYRGLIEYLKKIDTFTRLQIRD